MRKNFFGSNKHDPRRGRQEKHQRRRGPRLEMLETRNMLAADLRPISELGNNLANPIWGSAGADLVRIAPAEYADGISTPAGADRLSARAISNLVAAQGEDTPLNERDMSAFIY